MKNYTFNKSILFIVIYPVLIVKQEAYCLSFAVPFEVAILLHLNSVIWNSIDHKIFDEREIDAIQK